MPLLDSKEMKTASLVIIDKEVGVSFKNQDSSQRHVFEECDTNTCICT